MKRFYLSIVFLAVRFLSAAPAQVIILPTAETDVSGNLTTQGFERAGALPEYISSTSNLTEFGLPFAIFGARPSSSAGDGTQACLQTVGPTAQSLSLPIHSGYSKLQTEEVSSFILNNPDYENKNVLICWRPDRMQALALAFGVSSPPVVPQIPWNMAWVITFDPAASLQVLPQNLLASDAVVPCGCGSVPFASNTGYITPDPILQSSQVWSFVSEPALNPMKITVNVSNPGVSPGLILVAP